MIILDAVNAFRFYKNRARFYKLSAFGTVHFRFNSLISWNIQVLMFIFQKLLSSDDAHWFSSDANTTFIAVLNR